MSWLKLPVTMESEEDFMTHEVAKEQYVRIDTVFNLTPQGNRTLLTSGPNKYIVHMHVEKLIRAMGAQVNDLTDSANSEWGDLWAEQERQ